MPLPEHEVDEELIGYMVNILLYYLDTDNECFASTTFMRQDLVKLVPTDKVSTPISGAS